MTVRNKIFTGTGAILLVLAISNPTQKDFESYIRTKDIPRNANVYTGRTGYYLILSKYQRKIVNYINGNTVKDETYIGFFKNFIEI